MKVLIGYTLILGRSFKKGNIIACYRSVNFINSFSFSFYYILLFLVSKDNYLWIALILLFLAIFFMIGRIGMYLDFPEELNGKSEAVVIPLCFAFSCFNLFFKEVLSLKKNIQE